MLTLTTSGAGQSFTTAAPIGLQKTFVISRAVKSLSASTTAYGITTKHVFIGLESGQVMSIPLKVIDPRRPVGEPNKVEKAEGLMQYSPFLPFIPHSVVNYYRAVSQTFCRPTYHCRWLTDSADLDAIASCRQVERLDGVFSTPTKLESTALVLATGLDLYFTRLLPSKVITLDIFLHMHTSRS